MNLLEFLGGGLLFMILIGGCVGAVVLVCIGCWRACRAIVWRVRIYKWNANIRKNRATYPDILHLERIGAIDEDEAINRMIAVGRAEVRGKVGVHYPSRFDFKIVRSASELRFAMLRVHDREADEGRLRRKVLGFKAQIR